MEAAPSCRDRVSASRDGAGHAAARAVESRDGAGLRRLQVALVVPVGERAVSASTLYGTVCGAVVWDRAEACLRGDPMPASGRGARGGWPTRRRGSVPAWHQGRSCRKARPVIRRPHTAVRLTLTVDEAAAALGISRDHFERHILGRVPTVYVGRRRLIPVKELERWVERNTVPSRG
jgi:excisionase family DNA binding protein